MTADQLMECPFCGGKELGIGRSTEDREGFPTYIYCAECGAHGPYVYTRKPGMWTCTELAAQETGWNTRPTAVASHAEGEVVAFQYRFRHTDGTIGPWMAADLEDLNDLKDHPQFEHRLLYTHPPRSGDEALKVPDGYLLVRDPIHWGQEENKAWHRAIPSVRNAFIALANVTPKPAAMAARGGEKEREGSCSGT